MISLAVESFKNVMRSKQLQTAPPTNICYEFCSINDWDLARSVVALFVNCLTGVANHLGLFICSQLTLD